MSGEENPFGSPAEDENDDDFTLGDDPLDGGSSNFMIPAGDYLVACADVVKGTSSNDNPMWTWDFVLWENQGIKGLKDPGENRGKVFKNFTALTPAAMWKVKETLEALGIAAQGEKVAFKKASAIGRLAIATFVDDEYKGVKRSSITNMRPHPELKKLEKSKQRDEGVRVQGPLFAETDTPF